MDDWVEQERQAAGACPHCGSADMRPIAYGMPDAGTHERLRGVVVFAGCCVPDDPPRYACGGCGRAWGRSRTW